MGQLDSTPRRASWRKSSFCAGGECVEVAELAGMVLVRNSTDPRYTVRYTPQEWLAFLQGVKVGEFDSTGAAEHHPAR
jgi:Domain of unknown function (DUF397)